MTKRRVTFNEDIEIKRYKGNEGDEIIDKSKIKFDKRITYSFKAKHSLDSDEEEEEEDQKIKNLRFKDIEGLFLKINSLGQEEDTIIEYDEIRIIPFNMKDEMNDGHFDENGNFIFKKNNEIRDNWIDNIDWVEIKKQDNSQSVKDDQSSEESDNDLTDRILINYVDLYKKVLNLLKPGENILKAIKRLGKSQKVTSRYSASASERLKFKKELREKERLAKENKQIVEFPLEDEKTANKEKESMIKLTELADELLQYGIADIYDYTYERLNHLITQNENTKDEAKEILPIIRPADENLDMFDTVD